MLKVKIIKKSGGFNHIRPEEIIDNKYADCIFQEYVDGIEQDEFYINCGTNEKSVIHIWYDDECDEYRFATDDKESLKGLREHVTVVKIDAKISLKIKF